MTGSIVLLNLVAAIALLLWATRMVRTGVERAYLDPLQRVVQQSQKNRLIAAGTGMMVAVSLQSSTAVALIVSGFAASGLLTTPVGLAVMLGADLGSALVVQILSLNLSQMVPICLIVGAGAFLNGRSRAVRQFGRIVMGVGLLLISLGMISNATGPLRESQLLPVIIQYLSSDMITAFLVAAFFTWLAHSSVASVLLIMAFAAQGILPVPLALVLVLGANSGSGIIAIVLTRKLSVPARAIPMGNAFLRTTVSVALVVAISLVEALPTDLLGDNAPRQIVNFHVAFNLLLLVAGLPFSGVVGNALVTHLSTGEGWQDSAGNELPEVSALDPEIIDTPRLALAAATRELMNMSRAVETMLNGVIELFVSADKETIQQLTDMDDVVDDYHSEIKNYLAEVSRMELSPSEAQRCQELTTACIKLEHVGDVIVRNLIKHVEKKKDRGLEFSEDGWEEISGLHERVMANTQLALNTLISGDLDTARQLVEEKDRLRALEAKSYESHLERLSSGNIKSVESSEIHLDTIRDLKQINSALASLAYPALEHANELRKTRLKRDAARNRSSK
jgi:phosphate:Na+ symporter